METSAGAVRGQAIAYCTFILKIWDHTAGSLFPVWHCVPSFLFL